MPSAPSSSGGRRCCPRASPGAEGAFEEGDPVELVGPDGALIGRGLVAYDATEVPGLLGRSTQDLRAELGPGYDRELVHRDDLVLVRKRR